MTLPRIGITLGDPGGIGPEVTLKSLSQQDILGRAKYILFGASALIEESLEFLDLSLDILTLPTLERNELPPVSLWDVEAPLAGAQGMFDV